MNQNIVQKQLVTLDQTFLVFDIEQPVDADQKIKLNRLSGVGPIHWRFQTNSPTHYIVTPNSGTLRDDEIVEITITLHKNRFRPRDELILQATPAIMDITEASTWENIENMQHINFDIGTTVMNIEKTLESSKSANQQDFKQLIDVCASKGEDELKALHKMTTTDIETLNNNIEQSKQLKSVLQKQVEQKKHMVSEYRTKLAVLEGGYMKKSAEVERLQAELSHYHRITALKVSSPNTQPPSNCSIS
ncbi:unnamed protein product [Caenorhabditis angaria]|uniref:Major sperm protein n=1 Tax=Caenorhabditis angaria TaxID=860376 RepID=A0A9P1I586_9PELO|nr:unnamed protein product [Caenorhabditis angaria]